MVISGVYSYKRWTAAEAFDEAAKYARRSDFKRARSGAYRFLLESGLLAPACSHMRGEGFWHVFELAAVAIKYNVKADFRAKEKSAYNFCKSHGLVDLICSHMDSARRWARDEVIEAAAKCAARKEFEARFRGAYKNALNNDFIEEACAHMPPGEYGFAKQKPASLYVLRISSPGEEDIFKVGITNRDPMARVKGMVLQRGRTIEVLAIKQFPEGRDARLEEKRIHKAMAAHKYSGPALMGNGNTELFTANPLSHL